ncbi:unnamed protein product [Caenorhabditis auriculariae]|uniref:Piezo TM1-24 domain-containing protein n=1 Tax=Caenorhabditis auriculariae TaxID=2777116 RepID=A0A8S1HUC1_9PELO|nr:unnamed protein product [Caenorhabditis auriculariae]
MVPPLIKEFVYRIVLPSALLSAAVIRPSFISIGYVILGLFSALVPSISAQFPTPRRLQAYLIFTVFYTAVCLICQIVYQIYEAVHRKHEIDYAASCNSTGFELLRSFGFIRFHANSGFESSRSIFPEILTFPIAAFTTGVVCFLSHREEEIDVVGTVQTVRSNQATPTRPAAGKGPVAKAFISAFKRLSNFSIILFAAIVGCIQPSLLNFLYFFAFLFVTTWWASYKPLRYRNFNFIKKILILYAIFHLTVVYAYQIPLVHQSWIPAKSLVARLVGLSVLMDSSCPDWWKFPFVPVDNDDSAVNTWPKYANPIVLLVFFYTLVLQYAATRNGTRNYFDEEDTGSSVHEERLASGGTVDTVVDDAISVASTSAGSSSGRQRGTTLLLASPDHGEDEDPSRERAQGEAGDGIPLKKVTSKNIDRRKISHIFNAPGEEESAASKGMVAILSLLVYHAYALALASMMVWALLYHSVFSLCLLILTCAVWIFRDSRGVSFKLAPLIIFYIEFLLLLQYVLCMEITEVTKQFTWMEWMGISLTKDAVHAMVNLVIKVFLSLPVFLLLRLSRRERFYESLSEYERARRASSSYGTFSSAGRRPRTASIVTNKGTALACVLQYISSRVAIYFIFVVSLTLLLVATNFKPNFYTIGFFCIWALSILYLKVSFRLFRGVAYAFWLSLTVYTSVVIIVLYVYQFPAVSAWFQEQTHLSQTWLDAIGLVDYSALGESGALFLRLFAPICLFVVTMLQLKFFHDPWMSAVHPNRNRNATETVEELPVSTPHSTGEIDLGSAEPKWMNYHLAPPPKTSISTRNLFSPQTLASIRHATIQLT